MSSSLREKLSSIPCRKRNFIKRQLQNKALRFASLMNLFSFGEFMKSLLLICALLLPFSSWAANIKPASEKTASTIRASLSDMSIKSVSYSAIPGVFEIQVGDNIYYTNKTGQYLINGHMFDTQKKQDLTAIRLADITRISWADLPLDKAIAHGPKDGLKMAVFTDPDCPYCKNLEKELANIKGIRVYTFLFPLTQLHPDSYAKSESIWCAKNQHQALFDVMTKGAKLPEATCKTPLADIQKLGAKLKVQGTPTIFSGDGRKFTGGIPLNQIKTWLQQGH